EDVIWVVAKRDIVLGEFAERLREPLLSQCGAQVPSSGQHHLEGSKALLAVDDLARMDMAQGSLQLIQHQLAEEGLVLGIVAQARLSQVADGAPKRLPVLLTLPYVGALKERRLEPLGTVKDTVEGQFIDSHGLVTSKSAETLACGL